VDYFQARFLRIKGFVMDRRAGQLAKLTSGAVLQFQAQGHKRISWIICWIARLF
jgi:hypothetical protein